MQENKLATSKILEKEAELIYDYLDRLIDLIIDFTLDQILNFDETRFDWDQNIKYTFDFKGKDRVLGVKATKNNHPITILLAIRANGKKLPALMIFKEKNGILPPRVRELLKIPKNIVVKASRSGYIDENILSNFLLLEYRIKNS